MRDAACLGTLLFFGAVAGCSGELLAESPDGAVGNDGGTLADRPVDLARSLTSDEGSLTMDSSALADAAPSDVDAATSPDIAPPDAVAPLDVDAAGPPPDPCKGANLGNGGYCGGALPGGDPAALYDCQNRATASKRQCPMGCHMAPNGQSDYCNDASAYHLPWACGKTYSTTQGNNQGDHVGIQKFAFDFGTPRHTALRPSRAGTVTVAANVTSPGQGCYDGCPYPFGSQQFTNCCNACLNVSNHVNIQHADGTVLTYWHMDVVTVKVGQPVADTDIIGYSGTSGCSTGPHLHTQLMGNCPKGYCQSLPLSYVEVGVPMTGQKVTSQNCP